MTTTDHDRPVLRVPLLTDSPTLLERVRIVLSGLPVEVVPVWQYDLEAAAAGLRLVDVDDLEHADVRAIAPWVRSARRSLVLTSFPGIRQTYAATLAFGSVGAGEPEALELVLRAQVRELLTAVRQPARA